MKSSAGATISLSTVESLVGILRMWAVTKGLHWGVEESKEKSYDNWVASETMVLQELASGSIGRAPPNSVETT